MLVEQQEDAAEVTSVYAEADAHQRAQDAWRELVLWCANTGISHGDEDVRGASVCIFHAGLGKVTVQSKLWTGRLKKLLDYHVNGVHGRDLPVDDEGLIMRFLRTVITARDMVFGPED